LSIWPSVIGSALVATAAVVVAVRRPALAAQAGTRILNGLLAIWLLACALGILVLFGRLFQMPHRLLSYVAVIFAWWAFWSLVPLALASIDRAGGVGRCVLHLLLAGASLTAVLLAAFTGFLGRPPVTLAGLLRFRVLHAALVPALGTLAIVAWRVLAGRYRE
jgi:hypothetical protein